MFCPSCGKNIAEYSTFCIHCGAHFDKNEENTMQRDNAHAGSFATRRNLNDSSSYWNHPHVQPYNFLNSSKCYNVKKVSFFGSIGRFFRNYCIFTGRSTRREFWFSFLFWFLARFLIYFCAIYIPLFVYMSGHSSDLLSNGNIYSLIEDITGNIPGISVATAFAGLADLFFIFPMLAVLVRRLHDAGKSGYFALLLVIPTALSYISSGLSALAAIVIYILLFAFCIIDSDGDNKYGLRKIDIYSPKYPNPPPLYYHPSYYEQSANETFYGARPLNQNAEAQSGEAADSVKRSTGNGDETTSSENSPESHPETGTVEKTTVEALDNEEESLVEEKADDEKDGEFEDNEEHDDHSLI